jgi:hypothetical protein
MADVDIPPLYGLSGGQAFFEAWDSETQVLIVGRYATEITPELVAEVTQYAASVNDDFMGALIVPPAVTLTDAGRELCKGIIVYRAVMTLNGLAVERIDES